MAMIGTRYQGKSSVRRTENKSSTSAAVHHVASLFYEQADTLAGLSLPDGGTSIIGKSAWACNTCFALLPQFRR
jgi:hypothetical protein